MAVIGVATNGTEALRQARELSPDVALVDSLARHGKWFRRSARDIKPYVGSVILISSNHHYEDDDYAELIAGSLAVGFLSKATLSADVISLAPPLAAWDGGHQLEWRRPAGRSCPRGPRTAIACSQTGASDLSDPGRPVRVVLADDNVLLREGVAGLLERAGFEIACEAGLPRTASSPWSGRSARISSWSTSGCHPVRFHQGAGRGYDHPRGVPGDRHHGAARPMCTPSTRSPCFPAGTGSVTCSKTALKTSRSSVRSLQRVAGGGAVIDPALVQDLVRARQDHYLFDVLSAREREVLALMAEGRSECGDRPADLGRRVNGGKARAQHPRPSRPSGKRLDITAWCWPCWPTSAPPQADQTIRSPVAVPPACSPKSAPQFRSGTVRPALETRRKWRFRPIKLSACPGLPFRGSSVVPVT